MTHYREADVLKWNRDQEDEREGLPNLYISMLQAKNGQPVNLELQVMRKRRIEHYSSKKKKRVHEYLVFVDNRLNKLLEKMVLKYGNNKVYKFSAKQSNVKFGVSASNKVYERNEIESMLLNYIMMFPYQSKDFLVPAIENFKGETDEHSNNKLVNYIANFFEKHIILRQLNEDKKAVRVMQNGKTHYVNQEIEYHLLGDLELPKSLDGEQEQPTIADFITDNAQDHDWAAPTEFDFMKDNYKKVLTANQLSCFNQILSAIENNEVVVDDLFHKVYRGKLNVEAIGKLLFPDKENNYRQPAVRKMINSMRKRMDKVLEKEGIKDELKVIRSDYRPLPEQPEKENKQFKEYNIGKKYLSKNYYINDLHKNVRFYTEEQTIPLYDYLDLLTGKTTVAELMKKYNINKDTARSLNGAVYSYNVDENGVCRLVDVQFCNEEERIHKYINYVKYYK